MNILIADDNEDTRKLQETILGNQGYRIKSATNGVDALEMAKCSRPDIIISDIMMPEMDGFELCRSVKSDNKLKTIPFIFYTATYTEADDARLAISLGASRFIIKPTEPDAFIVAINEVIDMYYQRKLVVANGPSKAGTSLGHLHNKVLTNKLIEKVNEQDENEETFKTLVQSISGYLYSVKYSNGVVTSVYHSPQCEAITGYSPKEYEIDTNLWLKMVHKNDRQAVLNFFNSIQTCAGNRSIEHRIVRKNGQVIWVSNQCTVTINGNGKPSRADGLLLDITQRKETEENLKLMSLFAEMNPAPILRCDRKGMVQLANPAAIELLEIDSTSCIPLKSILPGTDRLDIEACISSNKTFYHSEGIGERHYHFTILGSNEMGMAQIYGSDISERKKAEDEMTNLEAQLRQAQKMETIGILTGGIAHDFNNILSPILTCTEIALEDTPKSSDAHESLKCVIQAVDRARDLIKQISTFSRAGTQNLTPLEVNCIIEEILKLLRPSLPSTIDIRQKIASDCGEIIADPVQMHQVLMNLCTNAYHAMREMGGKIEVNAKNVEVDKTYARGYLHLQPGPYIHLSISDTGHGMDSATMERIFDPFFTTKGGEEGTGLGLSVVHGIVMGHGGEITVESKLGRGTTFHIYLPRTDVEAMEESEEKRDDIKPFGRERILFVDDEIEISSVSKIALERLGYKVTAINDSLKALDIFRKKPDKYDLVITDLTMPKMTGIELSSKITAIRPHIPVILISGYSGAINPENINHLGIRECVMKPFSGRALGSIIRKTMDNSES